MKSKIQIILLVLVNLMTLTTQAQITFENIIFGADNNFGRDVAQTQDSGYIICGSYGENYYQWPFWRLSLTRTDKYGNVEWEKYFGNEIDNHGYSVLEDSDGNIVTCGYSQYFGLYPILLKTNPLGNKIFLKSYRFSDSPYDIPYSVKECLDLGYVLCGEVSSDTAGTYVLKTKNNGDSLWVKFYGDKYEQGRDIICLPDSGYVILSSSNNTILRNIDKDGNILWEQYNSFLNADAFARTGDGGYIVCGKAMSKGDQYEIALLKTDQTGDSIWSNTYPYYADANSIVAIPGGGYLIGGSIYDSPVPGQKQLFLLRLDHSGEILWTRRFGGTSIDNGESVRYTFDQGYIFTGTTKKPDSDTLAVYLIKGIDDSTATYINHDGKLQQTIIVYPDPSLGMINISLSQLVQNVQVKIFDISGNCIYQSNFPDGKISFRIKEYQSGLYFIKIITKEEIYTKKLLLINP